MKLSISLTLGYTGEGQVCVGEGQRSRETYTGEGERFMPELQEHDLKLVHQKHNRIPELQRVLTDPDTFGTVLLMLCIDTWGMACLHDPEDPHRGPWHPRTFRTALERDFSVKLPSRSLDKLLAAITIYTTDLFFRDLSRFVVLTNALVGHGFSPNTFEPTDAVECAWAISEALLLDPPDNKNSEPFADEIRHYITKILLNEGFVTPPDVLKIAIDGDFSSRVRRDFGDDPAVFAGIHATQKAKADELTSTIHSRLVALLEQIKALPFTTGTTTEIEKHLKQLVH